MGWIIAIIVGGIIGWLASLVMNRDASMGIFWNIIVGIVGSFIGGFIGSLIGIGATAKNSTAFARSPISSYICTSACRCGFQSSDESSKPSSRFEW